MIVGWLQFGSIVLAAAWIWLLARMAKLTGWSQASRGALAVHEPDVRVEPVIRKPEASNVFARWESVMSGGERVKLIIENPQWKEELSAYEAFKRLCADHSVQIMDAFDVGFDRGRPHLHFDDSALMPELWDAGYSLQLVQGTSLLDIIQAAKPFSLIILAVKDDGTQAVNHKWQERLSEVGIRALTREYLRCSYINVIWKKVEQSYVSLYEECSDRPLFKRFELGEEAGGYVMPVSLEVSSQGLFSGNHSSIKIDGQEHSPNRRGMNIVIFDLIDSKVERVHRVDTFVTMFDDTSVYRALPSKGEKHGA
ncbi:hypothetical protein [Paenibacillus sp. GCM10023250]|uniref:hypothetical protein n=1 Tax=Paenibacillus sp. GCM10023250 TaxID=3252648 RepID=UPI00360E4116